MRNFKKDIRDLKRTHEIVDVFLRNGFGYYINKINVSEKLGFKKSKDKKISTDKFPEKVRKSFEDLGGAFVKLGQLLSLRPDLIPEEYTDELKKLQDNVKPFSYVDVKLIIEKELNKSMQKLFLKFDKEPIAAASIGQVHRAVLMNKDEVIVKIKRPGIKEKIDSDIDILYAIAKNIERHFDLGFVNLTEIVSEFERYTKEELNYINEAKNVERIYHNFLDRDAKIPKVYKEFSSEDILTLEYIEGKKLNNISQKNDKKVLAKRIVDSVYNQIFIDGFFHADPHPGNIIVLKGEKIAFIDFGIMGHLDDDLKKNLSSLFIAAYERDIDGISRCMLDLGVVKRDVNKKVLKEDIYENFSQYYNLSLKHVKLSELFGKIIDISKKHNIKLPRNFILLGKSVVTMESVVTNLDPEFNPVKNAEPFVEELIQRRYNPKAVFDDFLKNGEKLKRFVFRIPEISDDLLLGIDKGDRAIDKIHQDVTTLTKEIDISTNRIAIALIIMSLLIASSLMINLEQRKVFGMSMISFFGFCLAGALFLLFLMSVRTGRRTVG